MRLRKPLILWGKRKPLNYFLWPLRFELWTIPFDLWGLNFELYDLGKLFEQFLLSFALNYLSSSPYPTLIYLGSPPFGGVGGGFRRAFYIPSSSAFSNSLFGCSGWSVGVSSWVALLIRIRLMLSMVTSNGIYSSLFGSGEPTLAPK